MQPGFCRSSHIIIKGKDGVALVCGGVTIVHGINSQ